MSTLGKVLELRNPVSICRQVANGAACFTLST